MSQPVLKYDEDETDLNKAAKLGDFANEVDPADDSEGQIEREKLAELKERSEEEDFHSDDDDSDAPEGYSEES